MTDPSRWSREQEGPVGAGPSERGVVLGYQLCPFGYRIVAAVVDYGLLYGVPWTVLFGMLRTTSAYPLAWILPLSLVIFNSGFMAAKTTQSLGCRMMGINVCQIREVSPNKERYISYVPVEVAILRLFLLYFDWFFAAIGLIAAFFTANRNTLIADRLTRVLHFKDPALPQAVYVPRGRVIWPKD